MLARWQGGGHPAAAAASIKLRGPDAVDANAAADVGPLLDAAEEAAAREAALSAGALSEASALLEEAVAAIIDSVPAQACADINPTPPVPVPVPVPPTPKQACADDIMTKTLHSCSPEDSMDTALEMMNRIKVLGLRHPRQPSP